MSISQIDQIQPSGRLFVFHLQEYNDVDHIIPIIWYFLLKGEKIRIVFLRKFIYENDYRFKILPRSPSLTVKQITKLEIIRNKILFGGKMTRTLWSVPINKKIRNFIATRIWRNQTLDSDSVVLFQWGAGETTVNFGDALINGAPVIHLPHGYNIFRNSVINKSMAKRVASGMQAQSMRKLNSTSSYIVSSAEQKKYFSNKGLDNEKLINLGSARFCQEWSSLNFVNAPQIGGDQYQNKGLKILFICPHWDYNVDVEATLSLIKKLSRIDNIVLVAKLHTRVSSEPISELLKNLHSLENIYVDHANHSVSWMTWADLMICFGSSICIDALNVDLPVVYPKYLSSNSTIFDDAGVFSIAGDEKTVVKIVRARMTGVTALKKRRKKVDIFLQNAVYGGNTEQSVLERYYKFISTS